MKDGKIHLMKCDQCFKRFFQKKYNMANFPKVRYRVKKKWS